MCSSDLGTGDAEAEREDGEEGVGGPRKFSESGLGVMW